MNKELFASSTHETQGGPGGRRSALRSIGWLIRELEHRGWVLGIRSMISLLLESVKT